MQPGQQHDQSLAHPDIGSEHPEPQDDSGVGIGHVKPGMGQTRPHDVDSEEGRNRQPQEQLHGFPEGHAQALAPIQGPQGEGNRARQGPVQHCGAQRIAPQQQKPATPSFQRCEGHEPQGVIGQMGRQVSDQHDP